MDDYYYREGFFIIILYFNTLKQLYIFYIILSVHVPSTLPGEKNLENDGKGLFFDLNLIWEKSLVPLHTVSVLLPH
jgi:hypothetical protein